MPKPLTIEQRLDRFPPIVCRLLARKRAIKGGGIVPIPAAEIARNSGLTLTQVASLSPLLDWSTVPAATAVAFARGCGIDLDDRNSLRHHHAYIKNLKSTPRYLLRSPDWKTIYEPLIALWPGST